MARTQGGVAHDAVADRQPRVEQPADVGCDADAHDDEIGVDGGAVAQDDALDASASLEPVNSDAAQKVGAVVKMQLCADVGHLLADGSNEWTSERLDHGDVQTAQPGTCCHLGSDEAGTDDDHLRAAARASAMAIASSAERMT